MRVREPWQIPWGLEVNGRNRLDNCVLGWVGGGGRGRKENFLQNLKKSFSRCVTEISLQTLSCKSSRWTFRYHYCRLSSYCESNLALKTYCNKR